MSLGHPTNAHATKGGSCWDVHIKDLQPGSHFGEESPAEIRNVFCSLEKKTQKTSSAGTSNYTDFPIAVIRSSRLSHVPRCLYDLSFPARTLLDGLQRSQSNQLLDQRISLIFPEVTFPTLLLPTLWNFPKFLQTNLPKQMGHAFCKSWNRFDDAIIKILCGPNLLSAIKSSLSWSS